MPCAVLRVSQVTSFICDQEDWLFLNLYKLINFQTTWKYIQFEPVASYLVIFVDEKYNWDGIIFLSKCIKNRNAK